jgi:hypothetical protein
MAETASDDLVQRMERLPPGHPSSPYDEDGTRKPPAARSADRELPLPDEPGTDAEPALAGSPHRAGPEQKSLDTNGLTLQEPTSPKTDGQEATSQKTRDGAPHDGEPPSPEAPQPDSRSWSEALPDLREQWDRHEERWPQEQRPQIDRSHDEPGCWRGDSGRALSPRDNANADAGCDRIANAEAQITARVEETERASAGELAGKDFRLKGRDRLKDKVAAELATNVDANADEVVAAVHDGVRYTLRYDDAEYTSGVETDVERMKDQGFELLRLKNLWNDVDYKGINSQWRDADSGQAFEVQFHTPESFDTKQITHKAYERLRNPQVTKAEAGELHDYQRGASSKIPIPIGASDIPEYP